MSVPTVGRTRARPPRTPHLPRESEQEHRGEDRPDLWSSQSAPSIASAGEEVLNRAEITDEVVSPPRVSRGPPRGLTIAIEHVKRNEHPASHSGPGGVARWQTARHHQSGRK